MHSRKSTVKRTTATPAKTPLSARKLAGDLISLTPAKSALKPIFCSCMVMTKLRYVH